MPKVVMTKVDKQDLRDQGVLLTDSEGKLKLKMTPDESYDVVRRYAVYSDDTNVSTAVLYCLASDENFVLAVSDFVSKAVIKTSEVDSVPTVSTEIWKVLKRKVNIDYGKRITQKPKETEAK